MGGLIIFKTWPISESNRSQLICESDITHRSAGLNNKAVNTEAADVFVCVFFFLRVDFEGIVIVLTPT